MCVMVRGVLRKGHSPSFPKNGAFKESNEDIWAVLTTALRIHSRPRFLVELTRLSEK